MLARRAPRLSARACGAMAMPCSRSHVSALMRRAWGLAAPVTWRPVAGHLRSHPVPCGGPWRRFSGDRAHESAATGRSGGHAGPSGSPRSHTTLARALALGGVACGLGAAALLGSAAWRRAQREALLHGVARDAELGADGTHGDAGTVSPAAPADHTGPTQRTTGTTGASTSVSVSAADVAVAAAIEARVQAELWRHRIRAARLIASVYAAAPSATASVASDVDGADAAPPAPPRSGSAWGIDLDVDAAATRTLRDLALTGGPRARRAIVEGGGVGLVLAFMRAGAVSDAQAARFLSAMCAHAPHRASSDQEGLAPSPGYYDASPHVVAALSQSPNLLHRVALLPRASPSSLASHAGADGDDYASLDAAVAGAVSTGGGHPHSRGGSAGTSARAVELDLDAIAAAMATADGGAAVGPWIDLATDDTLASSGGSVTTDVSGCVSDSYRVFALAAVAALLRRFPVAAAEGGDGAGGAEAVRALGRLCRAVGASRTGTGPFADLTSPPPRAGPRRAPAAGDGPGGAAEAARQRAAVQAGAAAVLAAAAHHGLDAPTAAVLGLVPPPSDAGAGADGGASGGAAALTPALQTLLEWAHLADASLPSASSSSNASNATVCAAALNALASLCNADAVRAALLVGSGGTGGLAAEVLRHLRAARLTAKDSYDREGDGSGGAAAPVPLVRHIATAWPVYDLAHPASDAAAAPLAATAGRSGAAATLGSGGEFGGGDGDEEGSRWKSDRVTSALARLAAALSAPLSPAAAAAAAAAAGAAEVTAGRPYGYQCEVELEDVDAVSDELLMFTDDAQVSGVLEGWRGVARLAQLPPTWLDVGLSLSMRAGDGAGARAMRESGVTLLHNISRGAEHRSAAMQQWLLALVATAVQHPHTSERARVEASRELLSAAGGIRVWESRRARRGLVPRLRADVPSASLQRHGLKALATLAKDPALHPVLLDHGVDKLLMAMGAQRDTAVVWPPVPPPQPAVAPGTSAAAAGGGVGGAGNAKGMRYEGNAAVRRQCARIVAALARTDDGRRRLLRTYAVSPTAAAAHATGGAPSSNGGAAAAAAAVGAGAGAGAGAGVAVTRTTTWARTLSRWRATTRDYKQRVYCTRALVNLGCIDDGPRSQTSSNVNATANTAAAGPRHFYGDSVFPVSVSAPEDGGRDVDIVLLHGLRGGAVRTWRVNDAAAEAARVHLARESEARHSKRRAARAQAADAAAAEAETKVRAADSSNGGVLASVGRLFGAGEGATVPRSGSGDTSGSQVAAMPVDVSVRQQGGGGDGGGGGGGGVDVLDALNDTDDAESVVDIVCWPDAWLAPDLAASGLRPRVLSLRYEANLMADTSSRTALDLEARASEVLSELALAGVGEDPRRPTVFVCHSMGGLLLKAIMARALQERQVLGGSGGAGGGGDGATGGAEASVESQSKAAAARARARRDLERRTALRIVAATRGVLFFAVPHAGSPAAPSQTAASVGGLAGLNPVVQTLVDGDPRLAALNAEFARVSGCDTDKARPRSWAPRVKALAKGTGGGGVEVTGAGAVTVGSGASTAAATATATATATVTATAAAAGAGTGSAVEPAATPPRDVAQRAAASSGAGAHVGASATSTTAAATVESEPDWPSLCTSPDAEACRRFRVLSLGEARASPLGMGISMVIVPPRTADPGLGAFSMMFGDHVTVNKPERRDDPRYTHVLRFVRRAVGAESESESGTAS